jgi:hypothetical protein
VFPTPSPDLLNGKNIDENELPRETSTAAERMAQSGSSFGSSHAAEGVDTPGSSSSPDESNKLSLESPG